MLFDTRSLPENLSWLRSSDLFDTRSLPVNLSWLRSSDLFDTRSLPVNLSWLRSSDLFWKIFLSTRTLCLCFLHLNFTITVSCSFKRWQACRPSGLTSCPVKESALQVFSSSYSSLIDVGTGFTFTDSRQWHQALVTTFFSDWITLSVSNLLQFFVIAKSEEKTSDLFLQSSDRFDCSDSFDMSSTVITSPMSSSFQRFSNWLFVQTVISRGWW